VARGFADFADVLDMLVPAEMDRDPISGFLEGDARRATRGRGTGSKAAG